MPSYCCRHGTCTTYLPQRGYCPEHQQFAKQERAARDSFYDQYQRDPETRKFYNSAVWKHPVTGARAIKLRSNPICQECGDVVAEHVHHIEDIKTAPEKRLLQSNLFSCCQTCHNVIEARIKKGCKRT